MNYTIFSFFIQNYFKRMKSTSKNSITIFQLYLNIIKNIKKLFSDKSFFFSFLLSAGKIVYKKL